MIAPSRARAGPKPRGLAFAPSVLEQGDEIGGEMADYVDESAHLRLGYNNEVVSSEDDENVDAAATLTASPPRIAGAAGPAGLLRARQGHDGQRVFHRGLCAGCRLA